MLTVGSVSAQDTDAFSNWALEFNCFPIDGAQEVPANASPGQGTGYCALNSTTFEFTWYLEYSDLTAPVTGSHFHVGAPGSNGGIQISVGTSNPAKGSAFVTADQADEIMSGNWYYNVHTTAFPGGELRGQIVTIGCPQWTNLHSGKAGTNRIVPLLGHGPMTGGSSNELFMFSAPPSTSSTLIIGLDQLFAPIKGGTLVPTPDLLLSVPVDATGKNSVPFIWPADPTLVGLELFFQQWYFDTGASFNLAASKGLMSTAQ